MEGIPNLNRHEEAMNHFQKRARPVIVGLADVVADSVGSGQPEHWRRDLEDWLQQVLVNPVALTTHKELLGEKHLERPARSPADLKKQLPRVVREGLAILADPD